MKKLLLITALFLGALSLQAQSKATAVVTLGAGGMTAKMDLNNATSTATLTLSGPSDRWFALQIGSFANGAGMQEGTDVVYWNGTTLVDAVQLGIGSPPSPDTNDWTMTSNTTSGSTRTIVATRAFNTGSADDYTIVYSDPNIDFAWARGGTATNNLISHGTFRGYSLNNAYTCVAPSAPTASAQTYCAGATVANLVATGQTGATFKWYSAANGGTALSAATVLTNGTTYYASQTVGDCESTTRAAATVTITTVPKPTTTSATQQFCSPTTIAGLIFAGQAGATFNWYNVASGGNVLPTTTALVAGNYYVSQTLNGCTSERLQITVSFYTIPTPIASEAQSFCSQSTVANLTATGQAGATLNWYNTATGGDALASTTVLVAGNYYVSQTVGTCVSARKMVTVSYITLAAPNVPSETPTVCPETTIANLTVTGLPNAVFSWYDVAAGGTALAPATLLVDGNTYFVAQTVGNCISSRRAVTVNIDELTAPLGEHNQSFCTGATVADLNVTGNAGAVISWHKPEGSPALEQDTVLTAGMYFATQTVNGCTSPVKEVVVTLLPTPNAPDGIATQQFEEGATVADLTIEVTVGATIKWYVMTDDGLAEIESTVELEDDVVYYVTQTVGDCESAPLAITADKVLALHFNSLKNITVYPNPVVDRLTISNNETITQVLIINMLGQTVVSQNTNSSKVEVITSQLQKGSYILKVATAYGTASFKIVK